MRELQRIAFLTDDFTLPSPGQQVLDRLLIGFSRRGVFERSKVRVTVWQALDSQASLIQQRRDDFGLLIAASPEESIRGADAIVLATARSLGPEEALTRRAILAAAPGTPIFVLGLLASTRSGAAELVQLATRRGCALCAGTALPGTFRLPEVDVPAGTRLREGLIVVQGAFPAAEFDGLEGLLPVLERCKHRTADVRRLRCVEGPAFWEAGDKGLWSWPLLAAAISRSHTPQGNPVLDGRTEDLVGLGLLPKLAPQPRGWLLEHEDGLRSSLLILDGAIADFNFAVRTSDARIISAQLFRPPAPQQEQYSRLAAALMDFFSTGLPPWPAERSLLEAALLAAMLKPGARAGNWINLAQ